MRQLAIAAAFGFHTLAFAYYRAKNSVHHVYGALFILVAVPAMVATVIRTRMAARIERKGPK